MKRTLTSLFLITALFLIITPKASATPDYNAGILGAWVNMTSNPIRIPTFRPDGTFTVVYVGLTKTVNGTWEIRGNHLHRVFPDGNSSTSLILELNTHSLVLETSCNTPSGPVVQVDRYIKRSVTPH